VRQSDVGKRIQEQLTSVGMRLPDVARILFLVLLASTFFIRRWLHLALVTAAAGVGALFAGYLIYVQAALKAYCPYCMGVDIGMLVAAAALGALTYLPRRAPKDERDAARDPLFGPVAGANDAYVTLAWGIAGALVTALPLIWSYYPKDTLPPPKIAELAEPGKITIVSFTDFECPHCRSLHEKAMRELEAKPDVVIKRFMVPLPFHKGAMPAALVYTCTPEAERHAVVEALYAANSEQLEYNNIVDYAVAAGVSDGPGLRRCMSLDETKLKIDQDRLFFYGDVGGEGLPTTYIGGRVVKGSYADKVLAAYSHTSSNAFHLPVPLMFVVAGLLVLGAFATSEIVGRKQKLEPPAPPTPPDSDTERDASDRDENDAASEIAPPKPKKKKKKKI
ncbi:MAG: thioredoxin domain-containing protein, partial [Myxococcales bacterium]|nr:thioredoxin domain-containing protein [Myxococcales bacterium]